MPNTDGAEILPPETATLQVQQLPGPGGIQTLRSLVAEVGERLELFDRIHQLVDQRVKPNCLNRFEDNSNGETKVVVRRNHNYAKTVHGIVRGSFKFLKDAKGRPIVTRTDYVDDAGPYYVIEAFGCYELAGEVTEAHGSFSSRDKFLGKKGGEFKDVQDVDERSVREAAITECFKKAVLKALGYGDGDEKEMEAVGKNTGDMGGHTFKKGKQGGSTDTAEGADKKGDIEVMCRALIEVGFTMPGEPKPTTPDSMLTALTMARGPDGRSNGKFDGWRTIRGISDRGLKRAFGDVKRAFDKHAGGDPGEGEPEEGERGTGLDHIQ